MKIVSYSQNDEDILLWRALSDVKEGFYIDVGANVPSFDSVTKLFYEKGWNGINIEPIEYIYNILCADRPRDINIKACIGTELGQKKTFYRIIGLEGLSTLDPNIALKHKENFSAEIQECQVEVQTLNEIIVKNNVKIIHFLKIDVEGAERSVLESIDLTQHRPWILVIESVYPVSGEPTHQDWEPILLNHDYDFVFFDGLNRFYVAKEQEKLKQFFSAPANCFDNFVRFECESLRFQIEELKNINTKLANTNMQLQQSISWKVTKAIRSIKGWFSSKDFV